MRVNRQAWQPVTWLLAWVVMSGSLLLATAAQAANIEVHKVISSENDERLYRYLVLPNKLRVLLVSDADTDKAAASLDVGVGSNDDPVEREGLAHFLEHMLFLGTKKYPEADEYQQFIASHGGTHNAYTSGEHTNYFFDVEHVHLDSALDRFAQFFIAPLFTPEYVERERQAVHSEFRAKIKDDYRRQLDVYRQLARPEHPLAKFSVGNLETLADREGRPVREDLLQFYRDYYVAGNMTLVVLGRESLDDLQAMVVDRFVQVESRKARPRVAGEELFERDQLPQLVKVKPLQDARRLALSFPVPSSSALYRKKPLQYIGSIIGHEGEGSLLSVLKSNGWAEGLGAGGDASGRNQGTFDITIQLTEEGFRQQEKVVALTFKMIGLLQQDGIDRWRYQEQAKLAEMALRFAEEREPIHTVSRLASQMHDYRPEDVIRGPYAFDSFDSNLIKRYLSYLSPTNLLWVLVAPEVETDQVSPLYQTPYRLEKMGTTAITVPRAQTARLQLPGKNGFIPGRLAVKEIVDQKGGDNPVLIKSTEHLDAWFKQDHKFRQPKADIRIRVYSALGGSGVRAAAMSQLYAALVNDALNEYAYPASLAGLSFSVRANSRGFDIVLSGYNDRQGLLLSRILDVIRQGRFDASRVENLKQELLRKWRNQTRLTPYEQLFRKLPVLLYAPLWDQLDMADALEAVTATELHQFSGKLWVNSKIQMLVYGNFFRQEALKFTSIVENHLYREPEGVAPTIAAARVADLPDGLQHYHLLTDHQDVAAVLYLQAREDKPRDRAAMMLIRQMLRSGFFHQLRTQQQLGYVVFLSDFELKDVAGNVFVAQSPSASLSEVMRAIERFVAESAGAVEDFELYRRAVLAELTDAPKNLQQQAEQYWSEIVAGHPNFERRTDLIAAVQSLTAEEVAEYSRAILGSPQGVWLTAAAERKVEGFSPQLMGLDKFDFSQIKNGGKVFTYR
ncbi:peptidase M16 [Pseudomaricurvus alcaniphilus]|uniref:insulinase family protein n=1 Tax=Pseudomaricurvus alcaniphilus TaxID=1166482 RepID=UPI00140E09F5|nr:insulinase family protein [Pseudomaricurvus alcaniphilus]NHN37802.1 peptidase M16 [Pseudomaricurvus alcaniphilus]